MLGATWSEIALGARLWIIPKERMKAGKEHRVALSSAAITLLEALCEGDGFVFPGRGKDTAMSNMAMLALLKRMGRADVTVHGFRSTFRDWAGEQTSHAREVIEHALAHQLADDAEAAYQRGDLLRKRRALMEDWATYCATPRPAKADVTPIRSKTAA